MLYVLAEGLGDVCGLALKKLKQMIWFSILTSNDF